MSFSYSRGGYIDNPEPSGDSSSIVDTHGFMWPDMINKAALTTSATLDADGESEALIFSAPKTGTIDTIGFAVGTHTTTDTVDVRLETVDATSGEPTGTLATANSNGSVSVTGTGYFEASLTAGHSVTKGDILAAVVVQGSTPGDFRIARYAPQRSKAFPYVALYTGSWAKSQAFGSLTIGYSDGSFPFLKGSLPITAMSATNFASDDSPDEVGIKFTVPHKMRVGGVVSGGVFNANYDVNLYNAADTSLASISQDDDILSAGATDRWYYRYFSSSVTLDADTTYRLAYLPTTTTNIQYRSFTVSDAAHKEMFGLENVSKTERTDAGSWTDTTTEVVQIALIVDGLLG